MSHAQRIAGPARNAKTACAHKFVDPRTGRLMLPVVNALAASGTTFAMTPGRVYCCILCDRVIDLRARRYLSLPEAPLDLRPIDELPDWLRCDDEEDGAANEPIADVAVAAREPGLARTAPAAGAGSPR